MKVFIAVTPEWGGYMPALSLAEACTARGHVVCFGGLGSNHSRRAFAYAAFVRKAGFEFLELPGLGGPVTTSVLGRVGQAARRLETLIAEVEGLIRASEADIALVDPIIGYVAIAAARRAVPVIGLKTNLLSTPTGRTPPFTSHLIPGPNGFEPRDVQRAWRRCRFRQSKELLRRPSVLLSTLLQASKARRAGLRYRFTEYGYRLALEDEFFLLPKEFDFEPVPGRRYTGGMVYHDRPDDTEDWIKSLADRRVVLCSLGTNASEYPQLYRHAPAFFAKVVEAFRGRPEYTLVLHIGDAPALGLAEPLPANVIMKKWVPQLQVLAIAQLMITHGGLGAIKECVHARVPMLVFPVTFDQPGNAARVVYHGLGLRDSIDGATAASIGDRIDDMMRHRSTYLAKLEVMAHHFQDATPFDEALDVLESRVARTPRM